LKGHSLARTECSKQRQLGDKKRRNPRAQISTLCLGAKTSQVCLLVCGWALMNDHKDKGA